MNILKIHNTLGNTKEDFLPINPKHIRIYACGPTVYSYAHIGNARMAVIFDTFVRTLKTVYPKVTYVSNITDIDDKIITSSAFPDSFIRNASSTAFSSGGFIDILTLSSSTPDSSFFTLI